MLAFGQDGQFSQYFASPILINPAISGVLPELQFSGNFKQGGDQNNGSFVELMQATISHPLKRNSANREQYGGLAATFFRERRGFQGLYLSQKVLFAGSYNLKLSEYSNQFISFGLQGGIVQTGLDPNQLQWGSQFNRFLSTNQGFDNSLPTEVLDAQQVYYPTFNFGVVYTLFDNDDYLIRDKSFTVGLSVDNLNQPVTGSDVSGEIRKNMLFKAFGVGKFEISPRLYAFPSVLALSSGGRLQYNGGFYLATYLQSARSRTSAQLHVGSWYRISGSFIVLGGIQIEQIRISGSLDLNQNEIIQSEIFGEAPATFEVSLTYDFVKKSNIKKISNPIF
jgi:type IX secretion system PorP/SprF family membrane protein